MVRAWPDGALRRTRQGELWITKWAVEDGLDTCPRRLGAKAALVGQLEVRLLQFLDVDGLESQHPHGLDKPGRAVHIPHPGVTHSQLEVHLTVRGTRLKVDIVSQVEPALGLHDVAELGDDVLVLPIELQLHVGLVVFEILSTHPTTSPHKRTCTPRKRSAITQGHRSSVVSRPRCSLVHACPRLLRLLTRSPAPTGLGMVPGLAMAPRCHCPASRRAVAGQRPGAR